MGGIKGVHKSGRPKAYRGIQPELPGSCPQHRKTETSAKIVRQFASSGTIQTDIADYMGIDLGTLRTYYKEELHNGLMEKNRILGENLYLDALNGCKESRRFWLSTKGKFCYYKPPDESQNTSMQTVLEMALEALRANKKTE
jgi:hypothetical protein